VDAAGHAAGRRFGAVGGVEDPSGFLAVEFGEGDGVFEGFDADGVFGTVWLPKKMEDEGEAGGLGGKVVVEHLGKVGCPGEPGAIVVSFGKAERFVMARNEAGLGFGGEDECWYGFELAESAEEVNDLLADPMAYGIC